MITSISRDPFARETLVRDTVSKHDLWRGETCAWCGNLNRHGGLYRYGTDPDSGRRAMDARLFCSISCRRAFHG